MFLEISGKRKSMKQELMKEPHAFCASEILKGRAFGKLFLFLSLFLLLFSGKDALAQGKPEEGTKAFSSGSQSEQLSSGNPGGVGVVEVPRADGRKDKIYFSTMTPEEESQNAAAEKEKGDRSWDMLRNIIIDRRVR
jgi:hypothetical protein